MVVNKTTRRGANLRQIKMPKDDKNSKTSSYSNQNNDLTEVRPANVRSAGAHIKKTSSSNSRSDGSSRKDGKSEYGRGQYGRGKGKKKKKMSRRKKAVVIVVSVLLGILAAAGIALAIWINSLNASMGFDDSSELDALLGVLAEEQDDSTFYMLIVGSDAREDEASRSDVTMLARVDPNNKTVSLISIPRDTMVTIDGYGTQKINAAYAYGGAAGAVECVSEFAGVAISHYVEVHFDELEEVVDALGGITVDVPESFSGGNSGLSLEAGEQVLTGEQALALARERYSVTGGDFGRAQAQRLIVEAIINKVLETPVLELPSVISQLASSVTTDLSVTDLIGLAQKFMGGDITIYSAACPSYTYNVDGVSYVATMFDEWADMMKRVDAGLDPTDTTVEIPEPQASSTTLGAATNSPAPKDYEALAANALTTDDVASTE